MDAIVDLSKNYSFFSIPVAFVLATIPAIYGKLLAGTNYDLAYPRTFQERVKSDDNMDKAVGARSPELQGPPADRLSDSRVLRHAAVSLEPWLCAIITKNRILRSDAAAANAQETLPLFLGSILAANVAGVPVRTINLLAAAYLVSRVAYTIVYVWLQENRKLAPIRTLTWNVGVVCWGTLFVKAGYKMLEATS
ncbi:hypothetical protein F4775DRAFT_593131 [Biscogniauxia sp. FL1348]|nr:hypothetical protein F4775DRAFT_593131 [Biscogniauxia sp. FL1348]